MSEVVDFIAWVVQKLCYSFYVFLKFVLLRILDLLGLVFNIIACLTIVRFPFMVQQLSELNDLVEWRYIGLLHFLIFISDIPAMIGGLVILLTFYRVVPLCKELKENGCQWDSSKKTGDIYYSGWKPRRIVLKHFAWVLFDVLFIPISLVCLCSWRCVIFLRELKDAQGPWERCKACFKQFFNVLLDIPCIILFLICSCTWRLPFVINSLTKYRAKEGENWKWDKMRFFSVYHFGLLLLDIPCLACFFVLMFTWRGPFFIRKARRIHIFKEDGEMEARKLALAQFLLILVDIPCIVVVSIILLTIWRFPFFIQDVKAALKKKKNRQWRVRKAACLQIGLLFVDVACLILGIVVFITLWRVYPLVQGIRKIYKRKKDDDRAEGESMPEDVRDNTLFQSLEASGTPGGNEDVEGELEKRQSDPVPCDSSAAQSPTEEPDPDENALDPREVGISERGSFKKRDETFDSAKANIGWKIRKAICIQFASLTIDIPAFAFLIVLIVTVVRMPKVLSTLLQSSDFYLEFAVTIYFQTFLLFVDIFFTLLFLVLMILRPFESWIRLLEDEEHMKYRLLCHYMQWIPDIIAKRESIYQRIEELLSIDLKSHCLPAEHSSAVTDIMNDYLDELASIRGKVATNELDPEYQYLLDMVIWWEKKRSNKAVRHFFCEYHYLMRPDARLRKENLERLKREMEEFEMRVNEQYISLKQFVPVKVPLWKFRTGLSTRTRKETQKVLIHCLPRGDILLMSLAFLCCLTLYRAPGLVSNLRRRWYDRANIVLCTVREIGYDLLTVLRIVIILVFLYRGPALLSDISIDITDKRSWTAVRETVRKYPMYMLEDFVNVGKTLLSWKTPRFLFTALLFGILMPADMFLTASKLCIKKMSVAYLLSALLYFVFVGFPFVMPFYLGKKLLEIGVGWVSVPIICGFIGSLLLILAIMVTAYVRNNKTTTLVPKPFDYFHWNWFNAHVILMEVLEFFQLLALVFSYSDIPVYGGDALNKASRFLLSSHFSFMYSFWICFSLFVIWFFLSSVPIIFEQILEDLPKGTCEKHSGWRTAVSLFANTLFITLVEGFVSCFACSYVHCPSGLKYSMLPSNSTCLKSSLKDESQYSCWAGDHTVIGFFGLFALVWYTSTSFLVTVEYGDPGTCKQDVEFSPTYNVISNFIKAIMVVGVVVITTNKYATLGLLIMGSALMILYTLLFKRIFHYKPTNSLSFMAWRIASYFSTLIAAISVIVAYEMDEPSSTIPLLLFVCGTALSLIVAAVLSLKFGQKGNVFVTRDTFKTRLLHLEEKLERDKLLLSSWVKQQSTWKYMLRNVRESRRDDQIFNEADWAQLKEKEQRTVTGGDGASNQHSTGEDEAAGPTADLVLHQGLPPPPSYNSVAVNATDLLPSFRSADIQEKIEVSPIDKPLLLLERNGVNLLLVLEKSILYQGYSYSFFSQRAMWLSSVVLSNWSGLVHCLDVLESNLDFSFDRPSPLDVSLGGASLSSDVLVKDPADDDEPPSFTPESTDPHVIEANSQSQRSQALLDIGRISSHGEQWKALMDKLLPNLPIIKRWDYNESNGNFKLTLRSPARATIKGVGPNGIRLAKGATISLGKLTEGVISSDKILFSSGCQPKGSKGPISVTVADVAFKWKKGKWYLESQGKTVKYDVALESMQELHWQL